MAKTLVELLPTDEAVLALGKEEIATCLLEALNSVPDPASQRLHRGNYLRWVVKQYRDDEVAARVGLAWDWAIAQEYLIESVGDFSPGFCRLSRKGLAVRNRADVELPRVQRTINPGQPPDFSPLTADGPMRKHLAVLWEEAAMATNGNAHLAAVIMLGSLLEGALLAKSMSEEPATHAATSAPRSKGLVKAWQFWSLNDFILVAVENHWINETRDRFSHELREFRNLVHPFASYRTGYRADGRLVAICWEVVRAALSDLQVVI